MTDATNATETIDLRSQVSTTIEAWAGEVRVNLIRLAALAMFYGYHVLNAFVFSDDPTLRGRFHQTVSLVVFVWAAGAVLLHFVLVRRLMRPSLSLIVITWDIVMVTALLCVCENPRSMVATAYFLIVASASLRFALPPVYVSAVGSLAGYLVFLGHARFVLEVPDELRVPRTNQIVFGIALAVAGLLAGQSVRQARRIAARALAPVLAANREQQ
ncbi:MAG: hypothetical protein H7Z17_10355 [Fuerstia sp.]|nr:hypothetical protein [Fuerstiella sp.]